MKRRLAALSALVLLVAAVLTQALLPSMAEDRLRSELEPVGDVKSVEVTAMPAAKLLLGGVDRADIAMGRVVVGGLQSLDADSLDRARDVESMGLRVEQLDVGPMSLDDVVLDKDAADLEASASIDVEQLEALVPGGQVKIDQGRILLELAELPLPLPGPVQLEIVVEDGQVMARPLGAAAALLPAQPLLERPEISVESLDGRLEGGRVLLSARGSVEG